MRRPATTMRDVAREAAVSLQTVSNVLNGRPGQVSEATRERVLRAVESLDYHRNPMARGLRAATADAFGFLVLDEASHFLADPTTDLFLAGVGDLLRDEGKALLIQSSRSDWPVERLIAPVTAGRVDAAVTLLSGTSAQRRRYAAALADKGRFVLLQEHGTVPSGIACVRARDRDASFALCRHLIEAGHERIAFLSARRRSSAIEQRVRGHHAALKAAGLPRAPELEVWEGGFTARDACAAARDLLRLRPRPTAIMCGNDLLALGVLEAARGAGLDVPGDLAVTGFGDFDFAAFVTPPLTTVAIPGYEMGRQAAMLLMQPDSSATSQVEFDAELRIRASSAASSGA